MEMAIYILGGSAVMVVAFVLGRLERRADNRPYKDGFNAGYLIGLAAGRKHAWTERQQGADIWTNRTSSSQKREAAF